MCCKGQLTQLVAYLFCNSEEFLVFEFIAYYFTDTVVCSEELLTHQTTVGSKLLSLRADHCTECS